MERSELEQWIEQHYGELLAVAKRKHKRAPEDLLQNAVAGMLASQKSPALQLAWPWAVSWLRGRAQHMRTSDNRQRALKSEAKNIHQAASIHGQRQERGRYENPLSDDSAKYLKAWARDARERLIESSRRSHHKGEPGVSMVRLGREEQHMSGDNAPIKGRPAVPWTHVSSSTGRQNPTGYRGRL